MQVSRDKETENIVGNIALASCEEEQAAQYLRERNLVYVNSTSQEVHSRDTIYTRYMKRVLDILIAFPAVVILLPINMLFAVCTYFDVGHPIFFRQTRVGKDEKRFVIIKFRNMNEKKDADGKMLPPSQRVTKFGYFMRKFSLDELLNFWSVLKGDMSIIGPRPMPVFLHERLSDRHRMRTAVRPGLECPRVIHIENEEQFKYQRTYENDIWYVEHVSFLLDVKMLFMLVRMVFSFKKRNNQAAGQGVSYFVGYSDNGYALGMRNYRMMQFSAMPERTREN